MDTAQRGMGLDYPAVRELVRRSAAEARAVGGRIVAGVATDQLPAGPATLAEVAGRVPRAARRRAGGRRGAGADVQPAPRRGRPRARTDYLSVYSALLSEVDEPVLLHWLGPMFDPALAGYWGSTSTRGRAADTVLTLLKEHRPRWTASSCRCWTRTSRSRCAAGCRPGCACTPATTSTTRRLIEGDEHGHSDALLGVFAAIAPVAGRALTALDARGRRRVPRRCSTRPCRWPGTCSRAPTQYYKTGIVFLSWLVRAPGPLHDGRRPAVRPVAGAPGAAAGAGRRGRAAAATPTWRPRGRGRSSRRAGVRSSERHRRGSRSTRPPPSTGRCPTWSRLRGGGVPGSGCGVSRWPSTGLARSAALVRDAGLA